jgi:hypothetical protein
MAESETTLAVLETTSIAALLCPLTCQNIEWRLAADFARDANVVPPEDRVPLGVSPAHSRARGRTIDRRISDRSARPR